MGIGTLLYGIYYVSSYGLEGNVKYLLFPIFAFFLYYLRRRMRLSLDNRQRKIDAQEQNDLS